MIQQPAKCEETGNGLKKEPMKMLESLDNTQQKNLVMPMPAGCHDCCWD
jgi:hypothetical protein